MPAAGSPQALAANGVPTSFALEPVRSGTGIRSRRLPSLTDLYDPDPARGDPDAPGARALLARRDERARADATARVPRGPRWWPSPPGSSSRSRRPQMVTSYANAAVEIHREGDQYVARVLDPFADHERFTEAFRAVGLDVRIEPLPASSLSAGKSMGMMIGGTFDRPEEIGGEFAYGGVVLSADPGAERLRSRSRPRLLDDHPGARRVPRIGQRPARRPARPGRSTPTSTGPWRPGGPLHGVKLRHGAPVTEVRAEAERRGLRVTYQEIKIAPAEALSFVGRRPR